MELVSYPGLAVLRGPNRIEFILSCHPMEETASFVNVVGKQTGTMDGVQRTNLAIDELWLLVCLYGTVEYYS
jgi:hypothetical protein